MNTFLNWLYDNEFTDAQLKMQQLKTEITINKDFSDDDIKKFMNWHPKTWYEKRLSALIAPLINSDIRIDEALTLKREDVNYYDMLIKIKGRESASGSSLFP